MTNLKTLLPIVFLNFVFLFAGCGTLKEVGYAVKESYNQIGPPPILVPADPVIGLSYILNLILGTWAAYERRRRSS